MKHIRDAAEKGPSHLPPARFRVTIKTGEIAEKRRRGNDTHCSVEDEAEVRAQLQGYVQRHTRQYGTEFAVTEFADGMELLDDYRPVYDILFLDVEMKHLDGMETARRVRELDKDVIIVLSRIWHSMPSAGTRWARWICAQAGALFCVFAAAAQGRRTAAPPRTALSGPAGGGRDAAAGFVPHLLSGKRGTPRPFLY